MRNNKRFMLLALLVLAIGFATVTTVLTINGTINLKPDEEGFKEGVVFTEYSFPNADDGTIDLDNTTGKTITFTTKDLKNVGDKAVLEYKIKNESYYDAKVTGITCYFTSSNTKDQKSEMTSKTNEYIQIKPEAGVFPLTIEKQTGKTNAITLTVEQVKSYVGDEPMNMVYQCVLDATTDLDAAPTGDVESGSTTGWVPVTGDGTNIGDEIAIGDEHFYVISNDGDTLKALAKYNLNVGSNKNPDVTEGIQDESVRGWLSSGTKYGNVAFSDNNGWPNANNDDINIKDYAGPVQTALYDETTGYEKYIQQTAPNATVRLITKSEIEALVNDGASLSMGTIQEKVDAKGYQWLNSTSFWSGSAYSYNSSYVWYVGSNGVFDYSGFNIGSTFGVRPVIEIEV